MGGSAQATIDHEAIRAWVEERGGCPARVKRSGHDSDPGILRIDFPGFSGRRTLEKISWDQFFDWFDKNELAFLHQDRTARGQISRFSKLVSRDRVQVEPQEAKPRDAGQKAERQPQQDPINLLEEQHQEVRDLFARLDGGDIAVAPDLLNALGLHLALEEAIVYPLLFESEIDASVRESVVEHVAATRLIADLVDAPVADDAWWAGARVLRREVEQHIEREEEDVLPVLRDMLQDEQRIALVQEMLAFIAETDDLGSDAALEVALSNTDPRLEQPPG
jgi:hypothetical protein